MYTHTHAHTYVCPWLVFISIFLLLSKEYSGWKLKNIYILLLSHWVPNYYTFWITNKCRDIFALGTFMWWYLKNKFLYNVLNKLSEAFYKWWVRRYSLVIHLSLLLFIFFAMSSICEVRRSFSRIAKTEVLLRIILKLYSFNVSSLYSLYFLCLSLCKYKSNHWY